MTRFHFLLIIILMNLIKDSKSIEDFVCSKFESEQLKNAKIHKMFRNETKDLLLFFESLIIQFKMPWLWQSQFDELQPEANKSTIWLFVKSSKRFNYSKINNLKPKLAKSLLDNQKMLTVNKENNSVQLRRPNLKWHRNKFKESSQFLLDKFRNLNFKEDKNRFIYLRKSNKSLYRYSYHDDILKLDFISSELNQTISKTIKLNYTVELAAYFRGRPIYFKDSTSHVPYESIDTLFEIDHNRYVHINRGLFRWKQSAEKVQLSMKIEEFFSCSSIQLTQFHQLKGVIYSKRSNRFFVFFNRNYIILEDDLIDKQFKIDRQKYDKIFFVYPFKQDDTTFELLNCKYVKHFRNSSLYVPNLNSEDVFRLGIDGHSPRLSQKVDASIISKCYRQILHIDDHVFCFFEKHYYLVALYSQLNSFLIWKKRSYQNIANIFKSSEIDYSSNQELELIFNYKNNSFVLMTKRYLFVFNYDLFITENIDDNLRLVLNKKANFTRDEYRRIENHILDQDDGDDDDDDKCNNTTCTIVETKIIYFKAFRILPDSLLVVIAIISIGFNFTFLIYLLTRKPIQKVKIIKAKSREDLFKMRSSIMSVLIKKFSWIQSSLGINSKANSKTLVRLRKLNKQQPKSDFGSLIPSDKINIGKINGPEVPKI